MKTLKEQLLANNYQQYKHPLKDNDIVKSFQKKIKDDLGVKYFISFHVYNDDKLKLKDRWEVELQFSCSLSIMDITLFTFKNDDDLNDIESYIDGIWERVEAHYYEKH